MPFRISDSRLVVIDAPVRGNIENSVKLNYDNDEVKKAYSFCIPNHIFVMRMRLKEYAD